MKITRFLLLLLALNLSSCAEMQQLASSALQQPLTAEEVGRGLKEALNIGIQEGAGKLASTDGYFKSPYKIFLPEEAQKLTEKLSAIPGFSAVENTIIEKINRAAEDAAAQAAPIFTNAIRQMTITDAFTILKGEENAATNYLKRQTWQQLYDAFTPVINNSLDKFNARKYWSDAVTAYNKIPLVQKMNPSLEDYVAKQALSGLFSMVEQKEARIRTDVSQRTTELLKKVFSQQG